MILEKLNKFEESAKFTNSKLTVASLAVMFKTNPTYLSETIKKHKEKNFNNYINDLRINYICKQILERPEFLNYKISYLAEEAGFSSHSSFTTVFKNVTGISPSVFLREADQKLKNIQ
ncbi:HTH-type transcriptional regulator ChbR [compost metagenome]